MAIEWEHLDEKKLKEHFTVFEVGLFRLKVPGGWLVMTVCDFGQGGTGLCFYPDPDHVWDGTSLQG